MTLEEKIKAQVEALLKPTLDNIADAIRYHTGNTKLIPFTNMPDIIKYQLQKAGSESGGDVVVGIEGVYEEGDTIRINFAGVNEGVANAMLQYSFAKATIDQTIDSTIEFTQGNSNARIVYKGTNADIDLTSALGNVNISVDENLPPNVTATGLDHTKILYPHKILGVEGTSMAIVPTGTKTITIERGVENMEIDVKEFEKVSITTNIGTNLPTYEGDAVLHNVEVNPEAVFFPAEAGSYMSGFWVPPVTAIIDSNIRPENIRKNVSILGEIGSYEGGVQVYGDGTTIEPEQMITRIYFNDQLNKKEFCEELDAIGLAQQGQYYVVCNSSETQFVKVVRDYEDATNTRKGYRVYIKDGDTEVHVFKYYYWVDSSGNITYDTGEGLTISQYNFKSSFMGISGKADEYANFQVGYKNNEIYNAISKTNFLISQEVKTKTITPSESLQFLTAPTGELWNKIEVEPIEAKHISYKFNLQEFQGLSADVIKHGVEILGIVGTYYGDNLSTEIPVIDSNGLHDVGQYEKIEVKVPMSYTGVTLESSVLTINNTETAFRQLIVNGQIDGAEITINGNNAMLGGTLTNSDIGINGNNNVYDINGNGIYAFIVGDSTEIDLEVSESEINLSNSLGDITITDNFTKNHTIIANNLESKYIKQGITILGVEGSFAGEQASGTLTITENGSFPVASYANVIVQVPVNSITGVTTTGTNGTMRIDHSNTVESSYSIINDSPYVTLAYTSGATVTFTKDNANANVNLGGTGGKVNIGSNCAGTYTINIGGRTMVVEFYSTGVLSRITLDGVEV